MKSLGRALRYAALFCVLDLVIFFLLYLVLGLTLLGASVVDAAENGALMAFARLLYLQWPLEFVFLALLRIAGWHDNVLAAVAAGLLAFAITIPLFFGGIANPRDLLSFFEISYLTGQPGPGLTLLTSVLVAWLSMSALAARAQHVAAPKRDFA